MRPLGMALRKAAATRAPSIWTIERRLRTVGTRTTPQAQHAHSQPIRSCARSNADLASM